MAREVQRYAATLPGAMPMRAAGEAETTGPTVDARRRHHRVRLNAAGDSATTSAATRTWRLVAPVVPTLTPSAASAACAAPAPLPSSSALRLRQHLVAAPSPRRRSACGGRGRPRPPRGNPGSGPFVRLQPLLQRRLVVAGHRRQQTRAPRRVERRGRTRASTKRARRRRCRRRGRARRSPPRRRSASSACLLRPPVFSSPRPSRRTLAEIEALGQRGERRRRHQRGLHLRLVAFVELGELADTAGRPRRSRAPRRRGTRAIRCRSRRRSRLRCARDRWVSACSSRPAIAEAVVQTRSRARSHSSGNGTTSRGPLCGAIALRSPDGASSACSAGTAMRTSPRPLDRRAENRRAASLDDTSVRMPCAVEQAAHDGRLDVRAACGTRRPGRTSPVRCRATVGQRGADFDG